MSNAASPITSGLINNSSTEASFATYDGSKIIHFRKGLNHGKAMSLNYQNVDFVSVPEPYKISPLTKFNKESKRKSLMPRVSDIAKNYTFGN